MADPKHGSIPTKHYNTYYGFLVKEIIAVMGWLAIIMSEEQKVVQVSTLRLDIGRIKGLWKCMVVFATTLVI